MCASNCGSWNVLSLDIKVCQHRYQQNGIIDLILELLRSYRIAHARVSAIEPFETTLRENTPLTSISDPAALVEYLNQLNLKSDMVLDELKRVSGERALFKQKLEDAEKKTKEALEEVGKLREHKFTNGDSTPHTNGAVSTDTTPRESLHEHGSSTPTASDASDAKAEQSPKSSSTSTKLRTPSIIGISLFSPKVKPADSPKATEASEEFFSYESELPRLEAELEKRNGEVTSLQREVTTLKGDLAVARESTQSMAQTLEKATLELNQLRERKERYEAEMANERQSSSALISSLRAELQDAESRAKHSEEDERLLQEARAELERLKKCDDARADAVANVGKLQDEIDSLRQDISNMQSDRDNGVRRVSTLEGLVSTLRGQLSQAEEAERTLKSEIEHGSTEIRSLKTQITEMEKDVEIGSQNVPAHQRTPMVADQDSNTYTSMGGETKSVGSSITSKKKNKKKKKNAKVETQQDAEPSSPALEPATAGPQDINLSAKPTETVAKLQGELNNLRVLLEEKDAAIETLHNKIKNGEDMQEEIDSLRDDLLHIGQEHVETKDKVKELLAEKNALADNVKELEKEISDLRTAHASNISSSEEAQKELAAQFDDLKIRAADLQTDLTVAQQLASARFKELTELRTVLQKAQPELTNLRSENGELRVIKDELTKKIIDLQRIEAQQDSAQTRITELKQTVAEKDAELKGLISRLNEEVLTRQTAENAHSKVSQEVQRLEDEKRAASLALDRISQELANTRKELRAAKGKVVEMEDAIATLTRDSDALKEDLELKTAQYASAESLMSSMRDQTSEMALQTKEARERCEGLEEEVAEAHRLLAERSREGETMRRLLAEIEGRTDSRIREMKERMEVAIEERDRAEDEASTVGRRRARELEEVRNKLKDVERTLRRTEEDKEELDKAQRDWKKRREELEQKMEDSVREAEEVRKAMGELRDALDESERQVRNLEKQKSELRKSVEETQHRLEKVQKANKVR